MNIFQDDPVEFNHASIVSNRNTILEAQTKIREVTISEFFSNHPVGYKILRYNNSSKERNDRMIKILSNLLGLEYGWYRLFIQLLDHIFRTNMFTSLVRDSKTQVCSSYVAWGYYVIYKLKFNDVGWRSCDPDDIDDESLRNPNDWEILEYKGEK